MFQRKNTSRLLLQQIAAYVIKLFNIYQQQSLLYHNLAHTQYVVRKTEEIAAKYSLNETELFILITAAWFHDTGQLFSYGSNHEVKSVFIMKDYLKDKNIEIITIDKIERCILATRIPHQPASFLEEVICDADTYNLGTVDFLKTDNLLKRECEMHGSGENSNWNKHALNFLEHHTYFTTYCQSLLDEGKQKNMNIIRAQVNS